MRHSRRRYSNISQSCSSSRGRHQYMDRFHQRPSSRECLRQRSHYGPYRWRDQRSTRTRTRRRLTVPIRTVPPFFEFSLFTRLPIACPPQLVGCNSNFIVEESDILSHRENPESSGAAPYRGPSQLRPRYDTSRRRETIGSHADIRTLVCHRDLSTFSLPSSYSSFHFQFSSVGEARLFDRTDER